MKKFSLFLSIMLIFALLLAACQPAEDVDEPIGTPDAVGTPVLPGTGVETPMVTPDVDTPAPTSVVETPEATVVVETPTVETPLATPQETPVLPDTGEESPSLLSNLLELEVWNANGDNLGNVNDMIVNLQTQCVDYVLLGAGGFLGIGEREVAIPFAAFQLALEREDAETVDPSDRVLVLNVPNEVIENAPEFDIDLIGPDAYTPGWDATHVQYWRQQFGITDNGTGEGQNQIGVCGWTGLGRGEAVDDTITATPAEGTPAAPAEGTPAGPALGATQMNRAVLASDLLDFSVHDNQGENLGDIDDAVVDISAMVVRGMAFGTGDDLDDDATGTPAAPGEGTPAAPGDVGTPAQPGTGTGMGQANMDEQIGHVQYVLISPDVALEVEDGTRWIAVPFDVLMLSAEDDNVFILNVDRDTLINAPSFDVTNLPDTSVEGWDTELNAYWQEFRTGAGGTSP